MYEYIEGTLVEKNPAFCIIETGGIGYFIQITLPTYTNLEKKSGVRLFIHQVIKEDAHLLFGFHSKHERETFRLLITVSGIGANTARMMLSSLTADEIQQAVVSNNTAVLQGVKGIGLKTAQRVIIDLRDKISKEKTGSDLFPVADNRIKDEALSALVILGFNKGEADKAITKILAAEKNLTLENVIRKALKQL
jgi:holliday junction DNA helicase RuvA